ncbi:MAG: hypothetical protein HDT11_01000 [Helicobacter sp.]|nr:hypothetical protein [Helicobacter sp.]MBD5167465.1 hypothetical protein [Helicobacter sp.]MDE5817209.1 hypothetical protein [Helicobacter sp.]MDE6045454.1 hypothetical protein [Helicobacter sp.]MDE7196585.1 hypothetical protein [Helicobacter sp.]
MSENETESIQALQQELAQKQSEIEQLREQVAALQESERVLRQRLSDTESVATDLRNVSSSVNDLMNLFMDSPKRFEQNEQLPPSSAFLESVELQNDKELLFGINIKQEFLQQSSASTIKYYLFACQCTVREEFEIVNLKIETKEQLALVAEAFAQYVRLTSLSEGNDLQGIVEALGATILESPMLKYYGDKTAQRYFHEFVQAYSKEPAN